MAVERAGGLRDGVIGMRMLLVGMRDRICLRIENENCAEGLVPPAKTKLILEASHFLKHHEG